MAREACTFVLAAQPASPKALYRLAQAHEGRDETSAALRALNLLLQHDSQNREARQMRERLKVTLTPNPNPNPHPHPNPNRSRCASTRVAGLPSTPQPRHGSPCYRLGSGLQ